MIYFFKPFRVEYVEDNNLVQNLLRAPLKDKPFEATTTICPTENYIKSIYYDSESDSESKFLRLLLPKTDGSK
jgi:hypothetical protein